MQREHFAWEILKWTFTPCTYYARRMWRECCLLNNDERTIFLDRDWKNTYTKKI
jgi:hypothetical protein